MLNVSSSDSPSNSQFTVIPIKPLSDQVWIRYQYVNNFENWLYLNLVSL